MTATPRLARVLRPLAAGYLLLGVAHISLLPPGEGFDESAHYSYIQELDTASVPAVPSRASRPTSSALLVSAGAVAAWRMVRDLSADARPTWVTIGAWRSTPP